MIEDTETFVGRGEDVVLDILRFLYPRRRFFTQVKLPGLVSNRTPKDYPPLSQRQLKETIDIVMATEKPHPFTEIEKVKNIVAFRIQDPHHKGPGYARHDKIQAELLEDCGIKVCDFNWYECKHIWNNKINVDTVEEVINCLRLFKIPTSL